MTHSPVIDIHVIGGAGWILLVLPAGWAADMDRLSIDWGTTSVKVPREPAAGKPLLMIRGSVGAGPPQAADPQSEGSTDRRAQKKLTRSSRIGPRGRGEFGRSTSPGIPLGNHRGGSTDGRLCGTPNSVSTPGNPPTQLPSKGRATGFLVSR